MKHLYELVKAAIVSTSQTVTQIPLANRAGQVSPLKKLALKPVSSQT